MAVPTITSVTPAVGPPGGGNLVQIDGTGFKLWAIPNPTGRPTRGGVRPTVRVRFGGADAQSVVVVSSTILHVQPPKTPLSVEKPTYGEGTVAIEVSNLDADGQPVPGETALSGATFYRYRRVQLAIESDLTRLCRALIREFKVQVLPNVSMATHSDYDPDITDDLNRLGLAEVPGIALLGPEMTENRTYSVNGRIAWPLSNGLSSVRQPPYTVDLGFTIVVITEQNQQTLNLMKLIVDFFKANRSISMLADPQDASRGSVSYEIEFTPDGEPKMDVGPDQSNRRVAQAKFRVLCFDIEDLAGFPNSSEVSRTAQIVEDPNISSEQYLEEP